MKTDMALSAWSLWSVMMQLPDWNMDRYILHSILGRGSYSTVKQGLDTVSNMPVAIKIMHHDRIARIPDGMNNLEREVQIHRTLVHPNIVQVLNVHQTGSKTCLVMEHCDGSIQDIVGSSPGVSQPKQWIRDLLLGLEYCHSQNIVHRDIKPSNLLLKNNTLKISDFGVAMELKLVVCTDHTYGNLPTVGSLGFQAPELISETYTAQSLTKDLFFKIDVWAAGVSFYFFLTGSYPFQSTSMATLFQNIEHGEYFLPSTIPKEATDLLTKMLTTNPLYRPLPHSLLVHPWLNSASET